MVGVLAGENHRSATIAVAWVLTCLAAAIAYWPGLAGPWVFDDYGSIQRLGDLGGVSDWETFKSFVFGGASGPTGRPLSLLTFLIDGQNWPTDAWPFKRTNLVIHILNGLLLGILIRQILAVINYDRKKAVQVAWIAAACWMLHPYLVSTTLYAVQRMAQLSTLFVFAGLIGFLHGRSKVDETPVKAYVVMTASLGVFTVLAMLSKENGILLPMLAGVLEFTILSGSRSTRLHRYWSAVFLVLPSVVIVLYLASRAFTANFFDILPPRDFSLYERTLTQARVLTDYLQNWFIPKLYTTGVFQDHFIKSTGWLTPVTTLFSALLHVSLIAFAVICRRRWRLLSLAILFYYVGHLLESTVLNLELYFEHRNYLPAALLFLPIIVGLREKLDTRVFIVSGIAMLVLLGSFTRYSSTVWQDYDLMVAMSARKAPTSARATSLYAANLYNQGYHDRAVEVLDQAEQMAGSGREAVLFNRIVLLCYMGRLEPQEFDRVASQLYNSTYDPRMLRMYKKLVDAILEQRCSSVSPDALSRMFETMTLESSNSDPDFLSYAHLHYLLGYIRAYTNQPDAAVEAFRASLDSRPDASMAMDMAARLATNNHHEAALEISDIAMQIFRAEGAKAGSSVTEEGILVFQNVVRADAAAGQDADTSDPAQ